MTRMIFCNTSWYEYYQGYENGIHGGGKDVDDKGYGWEMFNFLPNNGMVYGYVQPTKGGKKEMPFDKCVIRIDKHFDIKKSDKYVGNITVVWTAPLNECGTRIVGWYRDATVYKHPQRLNELLYREYKGKIFPFNITAQSSNAKLIPENKRTFEIPRGKGGMGQSNVWYGKPEIIAQVESYIKGYIEQSASSL